MISDRKQTHHIFHFLAACWEGSGREEPLLVGWSRQVIIPAPGTLTSPCIGCSGSQHLEQSVLAYSENEATQRTLTLMFLLKLTTSFLKFLFRVWPACYLFCLFYCVGCGWEIRMDRKTNQFWILANRAAPAKLYLDAAGSVLGKHHCIMVTHGCCRAWEAWVCILPPLVSSTSVPQFPCI